MKPTGYRRKGIASLPVSIFFVALVATAFVGIDALTSGQSGLASRQISAENTLAARQQELSGLSASSTGNGLLQLTESSGVTTDIVYAIAQESSGQTISKPVDYVVASGQTATINVTSLLESMLGGTLPSLSSMTVVTSRGIYITSQVQTVQKSKQVTTYQQQQVQKTGQQLVGYDVSMISAAYYSCNGVVSGSSLCSTSYSATQHTQYTCPSGETLVGNVCQGVSLQYYSPTATTTPGYYTCPSGEALDGNSCLHQQTYYTWVSGYYTSQQVPYYVPGYWSQYYVSGHWATYQYYVSGYWTSYTYSYTTYQMAQTGGYWSFQFSCHWIFWGWQGDMFEVCYPTFVWVPTYSWQVVVHEVTVEVWHPGYWATGYDWIPGYSVSYYVSGYWTTQTVQVWHPGYWQANTMTVNTPAAWHPPVTTYSCSGAGTLQSGQAGFGCYYTSTYTATPLVYFTYSCNSGDTLSGTTCEHSYPAVYFPAQTTSLGRQSSCPSGNQYSCTPVYSSYTYTVTETVPVTTTVSYETVSTQGSTWLVGG